MVVKVDAQAKFPEIVRVSAWAQYPWLRAGFSTRFSSSASRGIAKEFNLGWMTETDDEHVRANREAFVEAVTQGTSVPLVTVKQVHSATVRTLEHESGPLRTQDGRAVLEGDGLITAAAQHMLAILTADCVPVLVADTRTHAIGAFHAGWRGTLGQIAAEGLARMKAEYGSRAEDLVAAIGPCIRACCFAVGEEVRTAFVERFAYGTELFQHDADSGRITMDLVAANVRQLRGAGVHPERISIVGGCTACSVRDDGQRHFFSYRAENGKTGRMLSGIAALS